MLWGCAVAGGTENIAQIDGRIDSSKDQQILEANVTWSLKKVKLKRDNYRTMI